MFEFDVRHDESFTEPDRFLVPTGVRDGMSQSVGDLAHHPAVFVAPHLGVEAVAAILAREQIPAVMVMAEGFLMGLVGEREIAHAFAQGGPGVDATAFDVMRPSPVCFETSDGVGYVARKIRLVGGRAFPLLTEDGDPVGLLELEALFDWLAMDL